MKLNSYKSFSCVVSQRAGFTLIEVLGAIVLSAILIALMLPLLGSGLEGNKRALVRLPETHVLRSEMDSLWSAYQATDPVDLQALSSQVATAAAENPPPYILIHNDWVQFNADGNEVPAAASVQDVLRVTLGNEKGEQLTVYFFAND